MSHMHLHTAYVCGSMVNNKVRPRRRERRFRELMLPLAPHTTFVVLVIVLISVRQIVFIFLSLLYLYSACFMALSHPMICFQANVDQDSSLE